ncbi:(R)-1-hydroxy-2-aminoethylphosphonate ammonia-lyase [Coralliovum pocilloporae]|uniref:(R)-1-hydroxy-2-aminoethylphosphonate ammonia-lyase n=1 Tax=Coralliovum pocilloporae TaxID=3066369 RepID=UPI0033074735
MAESERHTQDGFLSEGESNRSEARAAWRARNEASSDPLIERDARAFLHQSLSSPVLSRIVKAEGIWIEDSAGNRFMDFHGNSAHHIGYGHPELKEAIRRQMDELPFAPRRFTCEPAVELAEKLTELAPAGLDRVLFTTGGSDAIEVALKTARAATGRFKTVSFWDAFHGAGFGAASVGGEQIFRSHIAGPLLAGTEHVAPFACYRCPYKHQGPDTCGLACAEMLAYVLEREGDVAAVIAEPMRAVPYVPPPGFWKRVREACDRHGALLIFDEIPTGLGKTGKFYASDHDGVTPDMIVVGKSLGGGMLPIAAAIVRSDLNVMGEFAIGHYTHEKNPVTARAGLTTVQIIERDGLAERAARLGQDVIHRLEELKSICPIVGDVRGRGLLFGVEIVEPDGSRKPSPERAEAIYYACLDQGLSFKISMGNTLTLSPPLVISETDLERALSILIQAIRDNSDA